jgi:hypothetical protein
VKVGDRAPRVIVEDVRNRERVALDGLAGVAGQIGRWLGAEPSPPSPPEPDEKRDG